MRKLIAIVLSLLGGLCIGRAQAPAPDTAHTSMPAIELPEITIVGKKAITLPFARKGEIFDVNIYEAPAPDSSYLISRPQLPLPVGEYTRLAERVSPWHASVGGGIGSSAELGANGFLSWTTGNWQLYGKGEYCSAGDLYNWVPSQIPNANHVGFASGVGSIISTDNDLLKSLSLSLDINLNRDSYNLYDDAWLYTFYSGPGNRIRSLNVVSGSIGSLRREGFNFGLDISVPISVILDRYKYSGLPDSSISVTAPRLGAMLAFDVSRFRFGSSLTYESAALDYPHATQSPSVFSVNSSLQWKLTDRLSATAGLFTGYGSGSDKGNYSLFLPTGSLRWELDGYREFSVWWQPEMHLVSYDSLIRRDPWLNREQAIRPERTPIHLGSSFSFTTKSMSLTVGGAYKQSSNHPTIYSLNGSMDVVYVDAVTASANFDGMLAPFSSLRLTYGGVLQRSTEESGDTQLPMTPPITLYGKANYEIQSLSMNVYTRFDYTGKQNIDFTENRALNSYVLTSVGVSYSLKSRLLLSIDLITPGNTRYYWWDGYPAPDGQIYFSAKWTLR